MKPFFLCVFLTSVHMATAQVPQGEMIYRFLDTLIVDSTSDISIAYPKYELRKGIKNKKVLFEQEFQNINAPLSFYYNFDELSVSMLFDPTGLMLRKLCIKLPGEFKGQSLSLDYDGVMESRFNDFHELNGQETIFNKHDGQPYIVCDYVNGLKEGYCKTFVDGRVARIEEYHRDSLNGIFQMFYPNGFVAQQGYFEHNVSIGKLITYDKRGMITRIEVYENGEVIDTMIFGEE